MSIYSGFATRLQEQSYDQCIDSLIYVLQKRIIKFYQDDPADEDRFIAIINKLHSQMKNMEANKYLEPKSSSTVNELLKYMHQNYNKMLKKSQVKTQIDSKLPELPIIQHQTSLPEKKNSLWVEKVTKNKNAMDVEVQTMGTIYQPRERSQEEKTNSITKKTINGLLIGNKGRNTSRSNFMRHQKLEEVHTHPNKQPKKRSMSNNLGERSIQIKQTSKDNLVLMQNTINRKKKARINSKIGNSRATQEEEDSDHKQVTDIIKQYMIRTKNKYWQATRNKEKEHQVKLNDF